MNWGSFEQFAHMGGYGLYVWGSYAVTFVLLAVELFSLVKRKKSLEQQITRQQSKRETTK